MKKTALVYLGAILAAELVTVLVPPNLVIWGIVSHLAVLLAIILHSALATRLSAPGRQFTLSLALAPLVRIISLSMPLASIPQSLWYPLIYTPLGAAAMVFMRIPGYRPRDIGLTTGFIPTQLLIALSGLAFGVIEYLILRPEPMVQRFTLQEIWLPALIFLLFIGFVEEFIFRGVLQKSAVDALGWRGILYVSFLFAILHMGFHSWLDVVFVFAVALFFGGMVKKTGSLLGVTLSHGLTNTLLYLVMPFVL